MINVMPMLVYVLRHVNGGIEDRLTIITFDHTFHTDMCLKSDDCLRIGHGNYRMYDLIVYLPHEIQQCLLIVIPESGQFFARRKLSTAKFQC
jgi:hypothetical protein